MYNSWRMQSFTSLQDLLTSVLGVRLTICSTQEAAQGQASATASLELVTEAGAELAVFLKIRRAGSRAEDWDRVFNLYRCTGCSIYNLYRVFHLLHRRELVTYRDVLPLLDTFVRENSGHKEEETGFRSIFPKFHGAGLVQGDLVLVFEDIVKERGAVVSGKTEQVHLSLNSLPSIPQILLSCTVSTRSSWCCDSWVCTTAPATATSWGGGGTSASCSPRSGGRCGTPTTRRH